LDQDQAYDETQLSLCRNADEEIPMVDVRKMVYLMVLPVFTALFCWALWVLVLT